MKWFKFADSDYAEHKNALEEAVPEWWEELSAEERLTELSNMGFTDTYFVSQIREHMSGRGVEWIKSRITDLYDKYKEKAKALGLQVED